MSIPPELTREIREASELLEAVTLDPVSRPYAALLTFVYVLNSRERVAWASRSVLWEVSPGLARVIFRH